MSSGFDPTLPASSADLTLPAESADLGAAVAAPVVSRGADFAELRPIDPANYVVGKEIARGGMGRILTARDRRLGRDVAIKELLVESSGMRVRFEREARITARLQHPSIVNVLEAGAWPSGAPFYVMRLVTGQSLDEAIAAKATLRERLALVPNVIAAVDALAYAHANRIIHRDLKPSNVLVGEFGETVVIDWGLAKDLDDASPEDGQHSDEHAAHGETVVGSVLGTPAYMPPEQALGERVTEAADVYSLGALLYHVLAGAPPYVGRAPHEVLAAVTSGPPVALGKRVADVPPDLLAIVERAMAHGAKDRYPSAGELAEDLKRFQTGQLVGAHAYTTRQLLGRWVRRHRGAVAVAVAALVVLATVGVISIRSLLAERAATEQARTDAEALTSYMLHDLHDKLQPLGKLDLLLGIAQKAVAYYAGRPTLTPDQRRKQSEANRALGDVLLFNQQREEALGAYTEALAVAEALDREHPSDPETQTELRWCHQRMWSGFHWKGDHVDALREARALLLVDEATTRARPDDVQAITNTASAHSMIGTSLQALEKWSDAMLEYEESRRELEAMLKRPPTKGTTVRTDVGVAEPTTHWKHELATMERTIGDLAGRQGDLPRAIIEYTAQKAAFLELADPANALSQDDLGLAYERVGYALFLSGDLVGANAEYREQLALLQRILANDPTVGQRSVNVALAHQKIGRVALVSGHVAEAIREFEAADGMFSKLVAENSRNTDWRGLLTFTHHWLGLAYKANGDRVGARAQFDKERVILTAIGDKGPDGRSQQDALATNDRTIGEMQLEDRDIDGALASFEHMRSLREGLLAHDPSDRLGRLELAQAFFDLGLVELARSNPRLALQDFVVFHIAATIALTLEPTLEERRSDVARGTWAVGDALAALGDKVGARGRYDVALGFVQALVDKHPDNAEHAKDLATVKGKIAALGKP